MAILQARPLTFEEANPWATGYQQGQNIIGNNYLNQLRNQQAQQAAIQTQFAQPMAQQDLQKQQLLNSILGVQSQYAAPTAQQDLLKAQLSNQILAPEAQYAPQMTLADLRLKQAQPNLVNAQAGLMGAQAGAIPSEILQREAQTKLLGQQAEMYPFTVSEKLDPLTRILYGRNVLLPKLTSQNGGMTIDVPNQGQVPQTNVPFKLPTQAQVLPGALQNNDVANAITGQVQPQNQPMNMSDIYSQLYSNSLAQLLKNPMFGSSRAGAGGTYVDPMTGQYVSSPSAQQTSRDQRAIAGIDNIKSYLDEAMKTMPNFLTASQKAGKTAAGISNYFLGTQYKSPSEYAAGKASLLESAEGFINSFGLNATNENVNKAADIMTPNFGESATGYKERVSRQLQKFAQQEQRAADRLRKGINIGQGNYSPEINDENLAFTAQENGMTIDEVKDLLRNGGYYNAS